MKLGDARRTREPLRCLIQLQAFDTQQRSDFQKWGVP